MSRTLIASQIHWNTQTLTAPAGKLWHLVLVNNDQGVSHNFVVSHAPEMQSVIFGATFSGVATKTFTIPGLPAGTYVFKCSIHEAAMTGVLTIK